MNPLLDTVEPTLWGHKALDTLIISNTPHAHLENVALYSRETVESLLEAQALSLLKEHELRMAECKKQALLEAACTIELNMAHGFTDHVAELRRMAEGEKSE